MNRQSLLLRLQWLVLAIVMNTPLAVLAQADLFDSNDPLEISLAVDFKELCRPREDENCDFETTELTWRNEQQGSGTLPVGVIIRGGWRAMEANCKTPLLFVRFDAESTSGTPFEGQDVLPLTTHCGQGLSLRSIQNRVNPSQYEQYLLKEYLAYRLFSLFSDVSLKVKLVSISYADPDKPRKARTTYAFFTEHFDSLAARTGSQVMERWTLDPEKLDTWAADRLAMFQYMIGNTDWSIGRQRNILLLENEEGIQTPVPFDLDMSGLVNAHYAGPPPTLPLEKVTQRYYLGYCHPGIDWGKLYRAFTDKQGEVFETLEAQPGLDRSSRRAAEYFLAGFFDIVHSDEDCDRRIASNCQPWPPTADDHMNIKGR